MRQDVKEWIQYAAALLMIVSGVVLSYISFLINGEITDGVLWYMAQALTFSGGIFGVSIYFKSKLGESEMHLKEFIREELNNEKN